MKEGKAGPDEGKPVIVDGKVDWEVLVDLGKKALKLPQDQQDTIVEAFEKIVSDVDNYLKSKRGRAALKSLKKAKQPLLLYVDRYPPDDPNGKILSYAALDSNGFEYWEGINCQTHPLTTTQAVQFAMRGEVKDLDNFLDFIKRGIRYWARPENREQT